MAHTDFNGDGRDDILWHNDVGLIGDWLAQPNGGFLYNAAAGLIAAPTDWQIAFTGDFNGDGRDDILWRGAPFTPGITGTIKEWLAQPDGSFVSNAAMGVVRPPNGWEVARVGDFNGDGRDDLLWRHYDGSFVDWLSGPDGSFTPNTPTLGKAPTEWGIAGTGDFNGDGRDDILWRNEDGSFGDWLAQPDGGFAYNAAAGVTAAPNDWTIVSTGDFNGDGRDDILWRNYDGRVGTWLGRADGGFAYNAAAGLSNASTDWIIQATGDYNGDGRDDILWRNENGTLTDWLAQSNGGFAANASNFLSTAPSDWYVLPPIDFTGPVADY